MPVPSEETRAGAARWDGWELRLAFGLALAALLAAALELAGSPPTAPTPQAPTLEARP